MPTESKPAVTQRRGPGEVAPDARRSPAAISIVAWLIPGAAHVWLGRPGNGLVFFVVLSAMFVIGLGCGGRLFPLQVGDPLVLLAALAEWGVGLPRLGASLVGLGRGDVVAASYEYGNTFLIAAGLLNTLIVLDAVDLATGRKA
jgi:hypothetical protein